MRPSGLRGQVDCLAEGAEEAMEGGGGMAMVAVRARNLHDEQERESGPAHDMQVRAEGGSAGGLPVGL